jgi:murein L,D-transpeptidase YafK
MKQLLKVVLCSLVMAPIVAKAQEPAATPPRPQNIKVLDEYSDGKGHIIRVVQFSQGMMRVTQTIIMPKTSPVGMANVPFRPDTLNKDSVLLLVDKSDYVLQLWYRKRMLRAYKAVFGPNPLMNKRMEGDRCTPEGKFKIASKNPGSKYTKFMGLNYPTDSSQKQFNTLKASGTIPATARIGNSVGIHGIWPGGDDMIDMGIGWTDGCIALKNKDIEELFKAVGVGTQVVVRK